MRVAAILFALFLAACGSVNRPVPQPAQPSAVRPARLRAPAMARQQCLDVIAKVIQQEEDIRFGDGLVGDMFGLPKRTQRPAWWLITSDAEWCKTIVVRNYALFPDGSIRYWYMLSRPIATSAVIKEMLADLFKCAERAIRAGGNPTPACGLPPGWEDKQ